MLNIEDLKQLHVEDLEDGDILVQEHDGTFYSHVIRTVGAVDVARKGVPAVMHTGMKVTDKLGRPRILEAVARISENPIRTDVRYFVVRPKYATKEQVEQAIAFGRSKIGRLYGIRNVIRLGFTMLLAALGIPIQVHGNDDWDPFCSQLNADQYDRAGYPVRCDGDHDYNIAPWDWLTPKTLEKFWIVGRLN